MADRHINMRDHDVRALLEGRKTMHRALISTARVFATPERPSSTLRGADLARAMQNADRFRHIEGDGWFWEADAFEWQRPHTRTGWMAHLGYAPGGRLWVREAWKPHSTFDHLPPKDIPRTNVFYLADRGYSPSGSRGRPSIHMPRWASRLTLIVEAVKVERLQDISEADAKAEGIFARGSIGDDPTSSQWTWQREGWRYDTPREAFQKLWNTINGPGAWQANPWVCALTFRVVKGNIDQIGERG